MVLGVTFKYQIPNFVPCTVNQDEIGHCKAALPECRTGLRFEFSGVPPVVEAFGLAVATFQTSVHAG
jgi:hypothetical protein